MHTKEIVESFEFNDSMKQTGKFVNCKYVCWQFQCISYYYFYLKTTFNCTFKMQAMLCDKYLNYFHHVTGILLFETAGNAVKSIT